MPGTWLKFTDYKAFELLPGHARTNDSLESCRGESSLHSAASTAVRKKRKIYAVRRSQREPLSDQGSLGKSQL